MKKVLLLLLIAGCNTAKDECVCDEVKDKQIVVHEHPYLYFEYNVYVEDCETGEMEWIDLHSSSKYDRINRGDCYQ